MPTQVFYIKSKAIDTIKSLASIAAHENSVIEISLDPPLSYVRLIQSFIGGADYIVNVDNDTVSSLSLKCINQFIEYDQDIIDDYTVEKVITISTSIKNLKQLLDNTATQNQIWFIDNEADTVSVFYQDCLQKYVCKFDVSNKSKQPSLDKHSGHNTTCSIDCIANLLDTHHFLYSTIYSHIIGKHTTMKLDYKKDTIKILSTNGRVMIISEVACHKIHLPILTEQSHNSVDNKESSSFRFTIDKGIIKIIASYNKSLTLKSNKKHLKAAQELEPLTANNVDISITHDHLLMYIGQCVIRTTKSVDNIHSQINEQNPTSNYNVTRISISKEVFTKINSLYKSTKLISESAPLTLQIHHDKVIISTDSKNAQMQNTIRSSISIDGYKESYKVIKITTWLDALITSIKLMIKLKISNNIDLMLLKKNHYATIDIKERSSKILLVIENYMIM